MTGSERPSWWNTLPGVLTGVAAIITAIGALIGALHLIGILGDPGTAPPSPEASAAPAAPRGKPEAGPPAEGQVGPTVDSSKVAIDPSMPGAVSQGLLTITEIRSADLESGVVGFGVPGQDLLVFPGSGSFSLDGSSMGSYLSPVGSAPQKDVCAAALATNRLGDIKIDAQSVGRWWCVRTVQGHTGAIQVKEASPEAPQLILAYVLWR